MFYYQPGVSSDESIHESPGNHDVTLEGGSAGITSVVPCSVLAHFIYPCFEMIWNCGLKDMHNLELDRLCRKKNDVWNEVEV